MSRPWTPNQTTTRDDGTTSTRITVKRHCNGCDQPIGDVTDTEMQAAIDGRPLPDVRGECPNCTPQPEQPLGGHSPQCAYISGMTTRCTC